MQDKMMKLLKDSQVVIPKLLLSNYKNLKMNELDLITLICLLSYDGKEFDPGEISESMNIPLENLLETVEHLTDISILTFKTRRIDGIRHEVIDLDNLYEKLLYEVIKEEEKEEDNNIYSVFEREFGRTLAPMEYEIINGWIDSKYSEELIISALKEAVYNGVFKLNYVDKILYEWSKKGIKNPKEAEKNKDKYFKKKDEKKDLYDYNWLEEYE